MHFIIISKKEPYHDKQIDHEFLNSTRAPTLISREVIKYEISNFIIYIYPFDHIDKEEYGYSYYSDENKILLCNGLVNINSQLRDQDISELFNQLNDSNADLLGDYQLVSIDRDGNGYIKTPPVSIRQLFFYEDEYLAVLSTEIKLIMDGVNNFRQRNFVDHFDLDFIDDSIFREWHGRYYPQNTIFKEIKRIFPYDFKYFRENKIIIQRNLFIEVPKWFQDAYKQDKSKLYKEYYESLLRFVELNLVNFKDNLHTFIQGLTGGYDSRVSVAILSKICKKHQIPLIGYTAGDYEHPDVIIAKKVADTLNIKHYQHMPKEDCFKNADTYDDYRLTFYMAQGDWNSNDYVPYYERKMSLRISPLTNAVEPSIGVYPVNEFENYQIGMSSFKWGSMGHICDSNRWTPRRIFSQGNFFFPLIYTKYEIWFAFLYTQNEDKNNYKEYIYEILKLAEPKLLDIPAVGDKLPQTNVKPYLTRIDSKYHEKEPFLWDYDYVRKNLKPLLLENYDKLDQEEKSILEMVGLNEFDYFYNRDIQKIMESYRKKKIHQKQCFKRLLKERFYNRYPRKKTMIKLSKKQRKGFYIPRLMILMDYATVANMNSFREIEEKIGI